MLKVYMNVYEDFISLIDENDPSGERFYTITHIGDDKYRLVAVVQNSRRRITLSTEISEKEIERINEELETRGFIYVVKMELS